MGSKTSGLFVILAILLTILGCGKPNLSQYEGIFAKWESPHKLRKMFVKSEEITVRTPAEAHIAGGFFLFVGGLSGNYKEGQTVKYVTTHVRFAWDIENNTYHILTLPLEKIRVRIVDNATIPTVNFVLDRATILRNISKECKERFQSDCDRYVESNFDNMLKNFYVPEPTLTKFLVYAIINVNSADWSSQIQLPLNGNYGS